MDGSPLEGQGEEAAAICPCFFSDNTNTLKFFITVLGGVSIFVPQLSITQSLRALLLTCHIKALRHLCAALLRALPMFAEALLICAVFWLIFAILGVQFFKGKYYQCSDSAVRSEANCTGNMLVVETTLEPLAALLDTSRSNFSSNVTSVPRLWEQSFANFDNIVQSLFSLFQIAAGDEWASIMYEGMDTTTSHEAPSRDAHWYMALYFVAFVVIGNFFTLNVLLGVLVNFFLRFKKSVEGTMLLSTSHQTFVLIHRIIASTMLDYDPGPPKSCFRSFFYRIVVGSVEKAPSAKKLRCRFVVVEGNSVFEIVVGCWCVLNLVCLAVHHSNMAPWLDSTLFVAHVMFLASFVIELVIRLLAFGFCGYFSLTLNRIDMFVVLVASCSFFLPMGRAGFVVRLLKGFRPLKVFFGYTNNAQKLAALAIHGAAGFLTLVLLFFVVFFVFGVIGVHLFGKVVDNGPLSDIANFHHLGTAVVVLYHAMLTERWTSFMRACLVSEPTCSMAAGDCGSWWSLPFFVVFIIISFFIMLQLCVAILLEHFGELDGCAQTNIIKHFADLKDVWRAQIGSRSTLINLDELALLLCNAPRALTHLPAAPKTREVLSCLNSLNLPLEPPFYVSYGSIVGALLLHALQIPVETSCFTAGQAFAVRRLSLWWRSNKRDLP